MIPPRADVAARGPCLHHSLRHPMTKPWFADYLANVLPDLEVVERRAPGAAPRPDPTRGTTPSPSLEETRDHYRRLMTPPSDEVVVTRVAFPPAPDGTPAPLGPRTQLQSRRDGPVGAQG